MFKGRFHTTFLICEKLFFNMQSNDTKTSLTESQTAQLQKNQAESPIIWILTTLP